MTNLSAAEIRAKFLLFFEEKGHKIVPSAPIVIKNDPTLLFTNAGMNQFKEYFLGISTPPHTRIADTQKCLRVSGKHNDLEEVGVDTYHHTMFEMLGNWSFGDYFKKEAIAWSWELLTEVFGIEKDRLYVTVFEGDAAEKLDFDQESYNEWKKWIDARRILKGNKKDNFWEMGDMGPCGPCSEIHIDCRSDEERAAIGGDKLVNADHPQVIEIWNNVFMQYNRLKDRSLELLPARHVDTGMGFERLVRVLQGKQSNYDTDIFSGTIALTEKITGKTYGANDTKESIAFRVLADHIRAICFTIADGQLPASVGAGYVVRRILRRAVRYYYTYLSYSEPLLHQLVAHIAAQFATVFPELEAQKDLVATVIKEEELSFLKTVEKGIRRFEEYTAHAVPETNYGLSQGILGQNTQDVIAAMKHKDALIVDGAFAFELYDTYGFPLDLTILMAQDAGWMVDEPGFDEAMKQQKARSRNATTVDTGDWQQVAAGTAQPFGGYDTYQLPTKLLSYRRVQSKNKEAQYQMILEQTPFYPEGGGQVGDTGVLIFGDEVIEVENTKKENEQIIHFVKKLPEQPEAKVTAKINLGNRIASSNNHTATHLLHAALRTILGTHVHQKGSLVSPEILRFDFSHYAKITDAEQQKVVELVNEKIRENIVVETRILDKEEAIGLGAMALFGEKYGDKVRTVIIDPQYSVELCGGTHSARTGDIGLLVIKSEGAVAAGVRRVEALTGAAALQFVMDQQHDMARASEMLKTKDVPMAVEKLQADKQQLEKNIQSLHQNALASMAKELNAAFEAKTTASSTNFSFLARNVAVDSMDNLKKLCWDICSGHPDSVVVLSATANKKALVAIAVSDSIAKASGTDANKLIKSVVAPLIKGGGGGSALVATAGGSNAVSIEVLANEVLKTLM